MIELKKTEAKIAQYHLHIANPEKLQFEIYDLSDYLSRSRAHALKPHSHSYYQIIWIFNGGGVHFVDFDSYPVTDNTIFFVSKNQMHYFDANAKHQGIIIHFNERFFLQSDTDIFLKYNVFNNQGKPCHSLTEEIIELANSYIQLIQKERVNQTGFGHEQVIRYLLKSLLIVLERAHRGILDSSMNLTNRYELQYLQFRELLEGQYQEGLTVSEYANLLHISTKTLTTITKAVVSKAPSELIAERIILEAQRLLSFTSLKVNEIGYRLGFEDPSYFVKYFKRHLNKSPSEYRKLIS